MSEEATKEDTTIRVMLGTKERLDAFKLHPRQSYDEVIQDLITKVGP